MKKIIFLTLLLSLTYSSVCWGLDLTWRELKIILLKENFEIKASENKLDSQEYLLDRSKGLFFPEISLSAQYQKTGKNSDSLTLAGNSNNETYKTSLNLTQNLFNGWATWATLSKAEYTAKSSQADLKYNQNRILYEVRQLFNEILSGQEQLSLLEKIRDRQHDPTPLLIPHTSRSFTSQVQSV